MNIFFLDRDATLAAKYHCDKHVVKMIVEVAQLLSNALPESIAPYKRTHYNHPMAIWVRLSQSNYGWTTDLASSLCNEYFIRYNKIHKSKEAIDFCTQRMDEVKFQEGLYTEPPRCFGDWKDKIPVTQDVVVDYRNYYRLAKSSFAKWKTGNVPEWYI